MLKTKTIRQPEIFGKASAKTLDLRGVAGKHIDIAKNGVGVTFDVQRAREIYDGIGEIMGFNVPVPAPVKRRRANGKEAYKGNGKHKWEPVTVDPKGAGHTFRLRVPGGYIYRTVSYDNFDADAVVAQSTVFVPMPDVVGYAV